MSRNFVNPHRIMIEIVTSLYYYARHVHPEKADVIAGWLITDMERRNPEYWEVRQEASMEELMREYLSKCDPENANF